MSLVTGPLRNPVGCSRCRLMEHEEEDPNADEPYVPPAENVLEGNDESKPAPEEPTLADTAEGRGAREGNGDMCLNQAVFQLATRAKRL